MDLIHLSDGVNSFRVRVLGRRMPGVLPLHDLLDTEVLIESGFVSGRLKLTLFPADLDGWAQALDMLAAGHDVCWIDDDRSPEIRVQALDEEQETLAVSNCQFLWIRVQLDISCGGLHRPCRPASTRGGGWKSPPGHREMGPRSAAVWASARMTGLSLLERHVRANWMVGASWIGRNAMPGGLL